MTSADTLPNHTCSSAIGLRRRCCRPAAAIILAVAISIAPIGIIDCASAQAPVDDWLAYVPGEARLYAELRDLAGTRAVLTKLGIWEVVRDLGDESRLPATRWPRRAGEVLGLSPENAINELIGRRTALIARDPFSWREGVVLAELPDDARAKSLLARWRARPEPPVGSVLCYSLPGNLRLAVRNTLFVIGTAADSDRLWHRTVRLLSGQEAGSALKGRSEFASLRADSTVDQTGIVYLAWDSPDRPGAPLNRLLIGFTLTEQALSCAVKGYVPYTPGGGDAGAWSADTLRAIPSNTLAAWARPVNFAGVARPSVSSPFDEPVSMASFWRLFLPTAAEINEVIAGMGPVVTILLSKIPAPDGSPLELPSLAAICPATDGASIVRHMDDLIGFVVQLAASLAGVTQIGPTADAIERRNIRGVEIRSVDLGTLLAKGTVCPWLGAMRLCWADAGGFLIVATSARQLEDVIASLEASKPVASGADRGTWPLRPPVEGVKVAEWMHIRGAAVSGMVDGWLAEIRRSRPELATDAWWRQWAARRLEQQNRLGLTISAAPGEPGRAVVVGVESGTPAQGHLESEDVIIGAQGKPLATTRPAQEIAERYRQRGAAREFLLTVERAGRRVEVRIPVPAVQAAPPGFNPILALERVSGLASRVRSLTLWRFAAREGRLDLRVELAWEYPAP